MDIKASDVHKRQNMGYNSRRPYHQRESNGTDRIVLSQGYIQNRIRCVRVAQLCRKERHKRGTSNRNTGRNKAATSYVIKHKKAPITLK